MVSTPRSSRTIEGDSGTPGSCVGSLTLDVYARAEWHVWAEIALQTGRSGVVGARSCAE